MERDWTSFITNISSPEEEPFLMGSSRAISRELWDKGLETTMEGGIRVCENGWGCFFKKKD